MDNNEQRKEAAPAADVGGLDEVWRSVDAAPGFQDAVKGATWKCLENKINAGEKNV
jgi:hypothetical protein